jgi:hypothetical protein
MTCCLFAKLTMNSVTQDRWTELMKIPQKYPKIVPKKYEKSWLIWLGRGEGPCYMTGGRGLQGE